MQKHNNTLHRLTRENAQFIAEGTASIAQARNLFASAIILSMRPKAPLRLQELLTKHEVTAKPGTYHGTNMWKDLLALKGGRSDFEDQLDHDRALELLRDRQLPDGCSVQDFSDKVNMLRQHHMPYLQRPFKDDEAIAEFFIDLMPAKNDTDGRLLKKELLAAGTLTSVNAVAECVKIVKKSESVGVRRAAAAAFNRQMGLTTGSAQPAQLQAGFAPALAAGIQTAVLQAMGSAGASVGGSVTDSISGLNSSISSGASKRQAAKATAAQAAGAVGSDADKLALEKQIAALQEQLQLKAAAAAQQSTKASTTGATTRPGLTKLPEGQTCPEGTCPWPHAGPCWRAPSYPGPLPEPQCFNERLVTKLNADKKANIGKPGVKGPLKLLQVKSKPANAAAAVPATDGDDSSSAGVDSFGIDFIFKPACPAIPVSDDACLECAQDDTVTDDAEFAQVDGGGIESDDELALAQHMQSLDLEVYLGAQAEADIEAEADASGSSPDFDKSTLRMYRRSLLRLTLVLLGSWFFLVRCFGFAFVFLPLRVPSSSSSS